MSCPAELYAEKVAERIKRAEQDAVGLLTALSLDTSFPELQKMAVHCLEVTREHGLTLRRPQEVPVGKPGSAEPDISGFLDALETQAHVNRVAAACEKEGQ